LGANYVKVAAALVFSEGKLLISQRKEEGHLGGLWEFPGGKLESNETYEACVIREACEELGVDIEVSYKFEEVAHQYTDKSVYIKFFICRLVKGRPKAIQCSCFRWVNRDELSKYNFPEADNIVISRLKESDNLFEGLFN
tara:strand:- start:248 stop:667 length:420 start_codon:yes stop_codon:yes gene_type:complete